LLYLTPSKYSPPEILDINQSGLSKPPNMGFHLMELYTFEYYTGVSLTIDQTVVGSYPTGGANLSSKNLTGLQKITLEVGFVGTYRHSPGVQVVLYRVIDTRGI
jgi:hypothetical protein